MEPRPLLLLKNKKTNQVGRYQLDQERALIGRDRSSYIVLEEKTVSRNHAEILQEGGQFYLQDLGSHNGTSLNNERLKPKEKVLLAVGDTIQIEDFELSFRGTQAAGDDLNEVTDTDILEIKMVKKLLKAIDKDQAPSLEVIDGPLVGSRYALTGKSQEILVGRDPSCEFYLDSDVISRKHARLVKRWDSVRLIDLGSKNGTYINKQKVKEKELHDGDLVHLGTLSLTFRNPQELSLEIVAPPPPKKVLETTGPQIEAEAGVPSSRAVKKGEGTESQALVTPETEQGELAEEFSATATRRRFQLSFMEVLFGLLGLVVVALSAWGLWVLLK